MGALKAILDERNNDHLASLIQSALDESIDHIAVFAETLRAHMDVLEIKNTRRLSFMALIAFIAISYLAFWELFAFEFVLKLEIASWSPFINYALLVISLLPMLYVLIRIWQYRP